MQGSHLGTLNGGSPFFFGVPHLTAAARLGMPLIASRKKYKQRPASGFLVREADLAAIEECGRVAEDESTSPSIEEPRKCWPLVGVRHGRIRALLRTGVERVVRAEQSQS